MERLVLQDLLKYWVEDRPVIKSNNNLETLQTLLKQEVEEFEESPDPTELSDIIIYALSIANLMGWDMDEEVREKIALNHLRFQAKDFQDGDYGESRKISKDNEREIIEEFYQEY